MVKKYKEWLRKQQSAEFVAAFDETVQFLETADKDTDEVKLTLPEAIEIDLTEVMFANNLVDIFGHHNQQELLRLRWSSISLASVSSKLAGDEV